MPSAPLPAPHPLSSAPAPSRQNSLPARPPAPESFQDLARLCATLPEPDSTAQEVIALREAQLTKPPGSLGRLEELTRWLGGWQGRVTPRLERVQVIIFAGNHGVTAQGVSPWPQEVTAQMVSNFERGGAAINQLARTVDAALEVVCVNGLRATADFTTQPAMSEHAFVQAVATGYNAVPADCDLLCLGEMGIGNTTAASTMAAAVAGGSGTDWAGAGTGLDKYGTAQKAAVVQEALRYHAPQLSSPLEIARRVGGFELAAMLGATLAARHMGIPVLLDGFVCLAAVAPLAQMHPEGLAHTCLSHCATLTGQTHRLASHLNMEPLLGLGLRLGEGSGAALAVAILRGALACHTGMATFAEAAVSRSDTLEH
ncbi:MAG: nicotinate-nucleotide--dimethylbenzimidazole phosphoribosyltransferase [Acetobacter papayae]